MLLAFLNLGPTEVAIVLVLFLLLFGVDKVPQMARSIGQAKAQMEKAQREVMDTVTPQTETLPEDQLAFERMRDAQMQTGGSIDRGALLKAAKDLGIPTDGLTDAELRAAVAGALAGPAPGAEVEDRRGKGAA